MRLSKKRWISLPVNAYTYLFRGTPLIIQLFVIYYGLGQFEWIKETVLWPYLREAYLVLPDRLHAQHHRLHH